MPNVLLVIPPDYDHNFPPLGTPALLAYLKSKGVGASQIDLNIAYREFLIGKLTGRGLSDRTKRNHLESVLKIFFAERLNGRYYSRYLPRNGDGISPYLPYDNNTNSSFYFTERLLSSPYLNRYISDRKENTFLQFYVENGIVRRLKREKVSIIGISVISPSQAIAALTLGRLIKDSLPGIHVNIGGQWPTLFRKEIMRRKDLFRYFDSVAVFEGERPILEIARSFGKGERPVAPNVILKDTVDDCGPEDTEFGMDELPCPDFDGLPLDMYDARSGSGATLTYETSRGCYWSRCAYCVDLPLPRPSYRHKDPRLVVDDIVKLKKRYGARFLMMSDPGMSPRQMLGISRQMIGRKVRIDWWTMARLDHGFDYGLLRTAARAGLKTVNFGFESASDRVCDIFDKGNRIKRTERIIRDCRRAGVGVGMQTMLGLPGETYSDALGTIDFLVRNKDIVSEATFNVYYLTPGNRVFRNPERYGIEHDGNRKLPFRFFTPFQNLRGMTKNEAHLVEQLYASLLTAKRLDEEAPPRERRRAAAKGRIGIRLNGESVMIDMKTGNPIDG